jgi:hypothetical protein
MKNTCELAFDILAKRPDMTFRAVYGRLETRRKIAPAGTISEGTRVLTITPCERLRWLTVATGAQTIAEIDQRSHWDKPADMAASVIAAIDARVKEGA